MSNRTLPPPFINEPPIYNDFLDDDGAITDSWTNWLNSITQVMGYTIVHDYIVRTVPQFQREEVPILQALGYSESDRDLLENARDGSVVYNTTTSRMNFREGGAWFTFAAVPA